METKVLTLRMSPADHAQIERQADTDGVPVGAKARDMLTSAVRDRTNVESWLKHAEATTDLRQRCETLEKIAYGQHKAQARTMDLLTTILAAMAAHWPDTAAEIARAVEADPESDTLAKRVATRMSDAALASTEQDKPS